MSLISASEYYNDNVKYTGDAGSRTNPYTISNIDELKQCTQFANYILVSDIDFKEYDLNIDATTIDLYIDEYFDFNGFTFYNITLNVLGSINGNSITSYARMFRIVVSSDECEHICSRYINNCKLINTVWNNVNSASIFEIYDAATTTEKQFTNKPYNVIFRDITLEMFVCQLKNYLRHSILVYHNTSYKNKSIMYNVNIKLSGREVFDPNNNYSLIMSDIIGSGTYITNTTLFLNEYRMVVNNNQAWSIQYDYWVLPKPSYNNTMEVKGKLVFETGRYANSRVHLICNKFVNVLLSLDVVYLPGAGPVTMHNNTSYVIFVKDTLKTNTVLPSSIDSSGGGPIQYIDSTKMDDVMYMMRGVGLLTYDTDEGKEG
jgi:hypothetical protein